jgi:hypothetical protein
MPNWCGNAFTVSHPDKAMIDKFVAGVEQFNLLQTFVPMPDELKEGDGWYGWCVNNWGTKWDINGGASIINRTDNTVEGHFLTAWSPPLPVYEKLTELGFDVHVLYDDEGGGFVGTYNSESGDDCYEFPDYEDPDWRDQYLENGDVLEFLEEQEQIYIDNKEDGDLWVEVNENTDSD